ncbi:MAG TPA: aromatic ring-hydroxylating dioxygenase subunit alpha [Gaiellaceae bacterium]|nr:aromatic ring-hydroxylating dioxygenase subunit alpha [Gaiellaceae bacterium]
MASGTAQATLPWSWYSDPQLLRLEQQRIFRRGWQYAGPAEHAADAGDFFTCSVGDLPVVVTRDRAGELHALLNVCRHRGSIVACGRGNRETLQCPYHAWTYGLDGRLRAAPRSRQELNIDGIALRPLAVETWGPLLFVHPDADAPPLAETLGPLPELVAAGGVELERLRFRHRSEFELACNWKIAVENYLECYHCAVAHPGFTAVVDVSPGAYRLETHKLGSSQFGPTRNGSGPVEGQFHWLWPVTKVYVLPGPPNLAVGPVAPLGPDHTRGFLDYFFVEQTTEAEVAELLAFDDQVGLEDRALVESVQAGMRSGLLDEGRLLPESERLLAHFQRLVREALA